MNQKLLDAMRDTAEKINEADSFYGKFALRKVNALTAESSLEAIVRSGEDIQLIAEKVLNN